MDTEAKAAGILVNYMSSNAHANSYIVNSTIMGNIIQTNNAIRSYGAGIYFYGNYYDLVTIENTQISNNVINSSATGSDGYGSGIYQKHIDLILQDVNFSNNKITTEDEGYGGALYSYDYSVKVSNCRLEDNYIDAARKGGSAIYSTEHSKISIFDTNISTNHGATSVENQNTLKISRSIISNNSDGGVISSGDLYLDNSLFENNAFALTLQNSSYENDVDIMNITFIDNNETIYTNSNSIVNIINSVFYNKNVPAVSHVDGSSSILKITNSYLDISKVLISYYGTNVKSGSGDPGFSNYNVGDYDLNSTSVLIDQGVWDAIDLEMSPIDFNNYERNKPLPIDIGAYEYVP